MPRPAPRSSPTQADALRRGIDAARLMAEEPRSVEQLGAALGLDERTVLRLIEGLRSAGVDVQRESRWRERFYSIRGPLPEWLARAIVVLAAVPAAPPSEPKREGRRR